MNSIAASRLMLSLLTLSVGVTGTALADESVQLEQSVEIARPPVNDSLMAPAGGWNLVVASGIPYLAIGEIAYGVTRGFTVGATLGVTPDSPGIGLRVRGVLAEGGANRLVVTSPILYYPASQASHGEPWVLVMPTFLAEHRFQDGKTVHVGIGAAATSCTETLGALFSGGHIDTHTFMGDLWATATLGGAMPLSDSSSLFMDLSLVSQGIVLGRDWVGHPPVIVTVGFKHTL
jgi:hypothetical protein